MQTTVAGHLTGRFNVPGKTNPIFLRLILCISIVTLFCVAIPLLVTC